MASKEIDLRMNELAKREMSRNQWTQRALGEEMGIQESEVSLLFHGRRHWTLPLIEKLSAITREKIEI